MSAGTGLAETASGVVDGNWRQAGAAGPWAVVETVAIFEGGLAGGKALSESGVLKLSNWEAEFWGQEPGVYTTYANPFPKRIKFKGKPGLSKSIPKSGPTPKNAKTLAEWLKSDPELLEEARTAFREDPEWFGIDPDETPVFLRNKSAVDKIRAKPGESPGHHPHGLGLGGPEKQTLTITGETVKVKNPKHSAITGLQRRIINAIKDNQ